MINIEKHRDEKEFYQAIKELFSSLDESVWENKEYISHDIFNRLLNPDRVITFDVEWMDDKKEKHINKGYRVQYNNVNGVYKGGLRFHPTVNVSILKFLAFEQVFKNFLTTLPMGGAKGGSDFDPKGKSDNEIKNFCDAFMKKLYPYIGVDKDVPAGDIGVGAREIETLYLSYKKYSGKSDCSLTGKPIYLGGSLCRKEATGFGVTYIAEEALNRYLNESIKGKRVIISGSGNVAIYCLKKVVEQGGLVVGMSDSTNAIYVPEGINFEKMRQLKEDDKDRIKNYKCEGEIHILSPKEIWNIPCDIAFPCATQFELDESDAKRLIDNGVKGVFEGANMPCTLEASSLFIKNKVIYIPGKAANAGGVATSGLEIKQNVLGEVWSFEKADSELKNIMHQIFSNIYKEAKHLGNIYDLVKGANNYAFRGIAQLIIERDNK